MSLENVLSALDDEIGKLNHSKQKAEQETIVLNEQLQEQIKLYQTLTENYQLAHQELALLKAVVEENEQLKADINRLLDKYENRIPIGPVMTLLETVTKRVEERQNENLSKKWHWMLLAAAPHLQEGNGIKKDHKMVLQFVAEGKADGLVTDEELEAIGLWQTT